MHFRTAPLLLLTAALACHPSVTADHDGTLDLDDVAAVEQAVVQGRLATADETYATVALTDATGTFCTGTLVAPQVVVTAAHCLFMPDNTLADAAEIVIVSDSLVADDAPPSRRHQAAALIPHEAYGNFIISDDPDGLANDRDIGLILLESPVSDLAPADVLPLDEVDQVLQQGTECIITGFGITNEQNPETGTLYIAEAPYVRRSESEFIVGENGTPDSCNGDSGGPIYVDTANGFFLVGATSRGVSSGDACGTGGIYGLVPAFDAWIESHSCGLYVGSGQGADIPDAPAGSQGTCEGNCGGFDDDAGCYCTPDCVDYGDCCGDYAPVCGGDAPAPPEPVNMDAVCSDMDVPVGDGDIGDGDGDTGDGDEEPSDDEVEDDGSSTDDEVVGGDTGDGDEEPTDDEVEDDGSSTDDEVIGGDTGDGDDDTGGGDGDDDGSSTDDDDAGDDDVVGIDDEHDSDCDTGGTQFTPDPDPETSSVDGCSAIDADQRTLWMLLPLIGLLRRRRQR